MIKSPRAVLILLTGLNLLNYVDRLVVSAVLPQMKLELGLSNFEGGLLAMIFFAGYLPTAPIFGQLGDRMPRKHLIAAGVVVWSAATVASGLATGVWSLFAARAIVGVGEASYATLAPTIIDDVTPADRKGRALAYFYSATPIGGALGYILGGQLGHHFGWRSAFFFVGGPGVVLALLCLVMAEPARKLATEKANALRDVGKLMKMDLYRQGVLGYCAYTAAIGGFSYWAPTFIVTRYHVDLASANTLFGGITVVAGALATGVGGRWADRAIMKAASDDGRPRIHALLRICAIGSAIGAPISVGCFLAPSATMFFVLVFFAIFFLFMNTSPVNAIVLQAVPSELRASAMALSIFAIHVLGDVWSPPLIGLLADHLPIELAMMALPVAIGMSALVWWPRKALSS